MHAGSISAVATVVTLTPTLAAASTPAADFGRLFSTEIFESTAPLEHGQSDTTAASCDAFMSSEPTELRDGDADRDGDVDLADYVLFVTLLDEVLPATAAMRSMNATETYAEPLDFDCNGYLDLADYSHFQRAFTTFPPRIRRLSPGDSFLHSERRDGTVNGQSVWLEGTVRLDVALDSSWPCGTNQVLMATLDALVNDTTPVAGRADIYFSQTSAGSFMQHGSFEESVGNRHMRCVIEPDTGSFLTLASPLIPGAVYGWDVTYDDGARSIGHREVIGVELIEVPAGRCAAWRIEGRELTRTDSAVTLVDELVFWLVPSLGIEVKVEYEVVSIDAANGIVTNNRRQLTEPYCASSTGFRR